MDQIEFTIKENNIMTDKIKRIIFIILSIGLTGGFCYYLYSNFQYFLNFGVALILAVIAVLSLYLVDKYLLIGYDTIEELKNGNLAVGLALIAYALIIGSSIVAAFVVYR